MVVTQLVISETKDPRFEYLGMAKMKKKSIRTSFIADEQFFAFMFEGQDISVNFELDSNP